MKLKLKVLSALLLVFVFVAACGGATEEPALDANSIMTAAVGTMVQSFFETQTAAFTPQTNTPLPTSTSAPTLTPLPSSTFPPLATATYIYIAPTLGTLTAPVIVVSGTPVTATVNPSVLGSGCNNLAFIRDVNIPAGTVVQKSEEISKIWKVQNTGTCNWKFQYRLVFLSGDDLKASADFIQKEVTVLDWAEVSIQFTAPRQAGNYTSYWRMVDDVGNMFGSTLAISFTVAD